MHRNLRILFLTTICVVYSLSVFAQMVTKKVVDIETGIAISYATIQSSDRSIAESSDEDGVIYFDLRDNLIYTFSHIGYKTATISS